MYHASYHASTIPYHNTIPSHLPPYQTVTYQTQHCRPNLQHLADNKWPKLPQHTGRVSPRRLPFSLPPSMLNDCDKKKVLRLVLGWITRFFTQCRTRALVSYSQGLTWGFWLALRRQMWGWTRRDMETDMIIDVTTRPGVPQPRTNYYGSLAMDNTTYGDTSADHVSNDPS
jgi:hypothetical protein